MPDGVPYIIPPCPDKLDLPRLENDIPKFLRNSRAFTEEDKAWWGRFFESRDMFYTPKEQPTTWPLDEVLAIKRRQQAVPNDQANDHDFAGDENQSGNPVASVPRPPNVSDSVVTLVSGQFAAVPEVFSSYVLVSSLGTGPFSYCVIHGFICCSKHFLPKVAVLKLVFKKDSVFVAIAIEGYGKIPVLGKVTEVKESTFKICYWRGSWRTAWSPWIRGAIPWTDELPKTCILLVDFKLNSSNKLESETVKYLRNAYQTLMSST